MTRTLNLETDLLIEEFDEGKRIVRVEVKQFNGDLGFRQPCSQLSVEALTKVANEQHGRLGALQLLVDIPVQVEPYARECVRAMVL